MGLGHDVIRRRQWHKIIEYLWPPYHLDICSAPRKAATVLLLAKFARHASVSIYQKFKRVKIKSFLSKVESNSTDNILFQIGRDYKIDKKILVSL